jgi:hypothetical protein
VDNLTGIELKDFSGGWNTEDPTGFAMSLNQSPRIEDFDISQGYPKRRNLFASLYNNNSNSITGLYNITKDNIEHLIYSIGYYGLDNTGNPAWLGKQFDTSIKDITKKPYFDFHKELGSGFNASFLPVNFTEYRGHLFLTNGLETKVFNLENTTTDIFGQIYFPDVTSTMFEQAYTGKYMTSFANRLWSANTQLGGNHIVLTDILLYPNKAINWTDEIWLDERKDITALFSGLGNLYAFQEDGIYLIDYPDEIVKVVDGIGAVDQRTIVQAYNSIIFTGKDGVYIWQGGRDLPKRISRNITTYLRNRYLQRPTYIDKKIWRGSDLSITNWHPVQLTWEEETKSWVLNSTSANGTLTIQKAIKYDNMLTASKKEGYILLEFTTNIDNINNAIRINYGWTNSENGTPATWWRSNIYHDADQKYVSIPIGHSLADNDYLKIEIEFYGVVNTTSPQLFSVVVSGGITDLVDSDTSTSFMYRMLPNACFYDSRYFLATAPDNTDDNKTNLLANPYCDNLAVYTMTAPEQNAWTLYKNRYQTQAVTHKKHYVAGCGKDLGGYSQNDYMEVMSFANAGQLGEANVGKPKQVFETPFYDFGTPDNDKIYHNSSISFVDKQSGTLRITWYVDNKDNGLIDSGFIDITCNGTDIAKSEIIEHKTPAVEGTTGNYGRRIKYRFEQLYGTNAEWDLLSIHCYYKLLIMKSTSGEL